MSGSDAGTMTGSHPAIRVEGLCKRYGSLQALRDVSMSVAPGEVRALMGLNGAGKSTLVKIISGVVAPDAGEIHVAGEQVHLRTPADAMNAGVSTVHQELSLVPGLTVADNIFLGQWPTKAGSVIDRRGLATASRALLDRVHSRALPGARVGSLSIGEQQLIEIARAIGQDAKVLILDEPTSSLSVQEGDELIALVRKLAATGVAVVYISHRMDEIHRVADSATVLRDGQLVDTVDLASTDTRSMFAMMTGRRQIDPGELPATDPEAPVVLSVRGLSNAALANISFDLTQGELLGVAGVLGSGRTSLLEAIVGAQPSTGDVIVRGVPTGRRSVARMRRHGIGLAPESRRTHGLAMSLPIGSNISMGSLPSISVAGVLSARRENRLLSHVMQRLSVRWRLADPPSTLSGGNQQRVVLGRWLANGATVLLLDEPTRGVDVQGKREIYDLLLELSAAGISTIFATSEFEELYRLATRSLVLRHGRLIADVDLRDIDEEELMMLAMGEHRPSAMARIEESS
ncbi:sugar ABC transporter ATP-binding protein [Mycolicibacterium sp.]|uniref:sugar ABC transporter ATP-binding protein n=1 Tax=Mycolicibacterium sp. TaxID=2320850 RepID=UPI003D11D027